MNIPRPFGVSRALWLAAIVWLAVVAYDLTWPV